MSKVWFSGAIVTSRFRFGRVTLAGPFSIHWLHWNGRPASVMTCVPP
ncbi:MAG TPA: hypothetical protein VFD92_11470 [Candidatus Binatia bacterium]|nr:hypothetical protein [Candidatus Binatia bacterium]